MTGREQRGGNLSEVGGPKPILGEGFYGMFPLSLNFPPPLPLSEYRAVRPSVLSAPNHRIRNR